MENLSYYSLLLLLFALLAKYARLIVGEHLNGFLVFCLMSLYTLLVPYVWLLLLQFTLMYIVWAPGSQNTATSWEWRERLPVLQATAYVILFKLYCTEMNITHAQR